MFLCDGREVHKLRKKLYSTYMYMYVLIMVLISPPDTPVGHFGRHLSQPNTPGLHLELTSCSQCSKCHRLLYDEVIH